MLSDSSDWEEFFTAEGRPYYLNKLTGETSWEKMTSGVTGVHAGFFLLHSGVTDLRFLAVMAASAKTGAAASVERRPRIACVLLWPWLRSMTMLFLRMCVCESAHSFIWICVRV